MKANERQRTVHGDYRKVVEIFLDNKDTVRTVKRMVDLFYAVPTVSLGNAGKYVGYLIAMDDGKQTPNGTPTTLEEAYIREVKRRMLPVEPEVVEVEQSFRARYNVLMSEFGRLFKEMAQAAVKTDDSSS